jgi:uncharacterized protein YkwD
MRRFAMVCASVTIALLGATDFVRAQAHQPVFEGQVLDRDTGAPLAGVRVLIGTALVAGARSPAELPRDVEAVTTGIDGAFAFAGIPRARRLFVEVLPADGHFPLHTHIDAPPSYAVYRVSHPTPQESAWLAKLNGDRAELGLNPLIFDELAEETARYRALEMALSGIFEHRDAFSYYEGLGGAYPPGLSSAAENIGVIEAPSTWLEAQHAFMLSVEHHRAIVNPKAVWAGVGLARDGKPPATWNGPVDYYAQLFVNGP